MSFLNDTYCQLCEKLITKEQWNKQLYSARLLHKKAYGYTPVYFPNRKLTGDESSFFEKAFWKVSFATSDIKEVEEFWSTYFMKTTNIKDYFLEYNKEDVRKVFGETMEGQFEPDLYKKFFSSQLDSNDEIDTLQQRIKWWMLIIDRGGPIPNNAYDYIFNELFGLYRKATDTEMQELAKALRDRHIFLLKISVNESESNQNFLYMKFIAKDLNLTISQVNLIFIILMTFGC